MSFAVFVNLFGAGKKAISKIPRSPHFPALTKPQRLGLLTLFVPQAQVNVHRSPNSTRASIQAAWDKNQERLLGVFVACNFLALLLIFFLVPETAGASVRKEHGKLNYMSLEELNYIFGVPTKRHVQYQVRHVMPWVGQMVSYWFRRFVLREEGQRPYIEKMYYWVAVKQEEEDQEEDRESGEVVVEEAKEAGTEEHREVVAGTGSTGQSSTVTSPRHPAWDWEGQPD